MSPTPYASEKIEIASHVSEARYGYTSSERTHDFLFLTGREHCSPNYDLQRSSFPYLILEMIVGGQGYLNLGSESRPISGGVCFCTGFDTAMRLQSSPDDPLHKYFIAFGSGSIARRLKSKLLFPGLIYNCPEVGMIEKWGQLILEECSSQSDSTTENVVSLVNILLRKIAPFAENTAPARRTDALVIKAIRQIENHFQEISSTKELAVRLNVTSEHLCRVFKISGRNSPYKMLSRRKMEHAYTQIKLSSLPIQDIAINLGFTDAFHFSRAFKKHYGISPSSIRKH